MCPDFVALMRNQIASSEQACSLVSAVLLSRKEGRLLIIGGKMGATGAPTRSSGCEQWPSLVGLKKEAVFYPI